MATTTIGLSQSKSNSFIYQPGGTDDPNVFTTWENLYQAVSQFEGNYFIELDPTFAKCVVPPGFYRMDGCTFMPRYPLTSDVGFLAPPPIKLYVLDDSILVNVRGVCGPVHVLTYQTISPNFDFYPTGSGGGSPTGGNSAVFYLTEGAYLENVGTQPVCRLVKSSDRIYNLQVVLRNVTTRYAQTSLGASFVDLQSGDVGSDPTVNFVITDGAVLQGYQTDQNRGVVSGIATAFASFWYDSSANLGNPASLPNTAPRNPNFAGTITNQSIN